MVTLYVLGMDARLGRYHERFPFPEQWSPIQIKINARSKVMLSPTLISPNVNFPCSSEAYFVSIINMLENLSAAEVSIPGDRASS